MNKMDISGRFLVAGEAVSGFGEDSYLLDQKENMAIAAVFDGCGGIGARRYEPFRNHTGAYMASRAVCGATSVWFSEGAQDVDALKARIDQALAVCREYSGASSLMRGSMGKSFPTTAAILVAQSDRNAVNVSCISAGDSRCYCLDGYGLHQLTADDTDNQDALENLTDDGVLQNVISAEKRYVLNEKRYTFTNPCVLFSATDGCFAYLKTPMHFELLLENALARASSYEEWAQNLKASFAEVAGDDFSLSMYAFGIESFSALKQLYPRYRWQYEELDQEEYYKAVWKQYRNSYSLFQSQGMQ